MPPGPPPSESATTYLVADSFNFVWNYIDIDPRDLNVSLIDLVAAAQSSCASSYLGSFSLALLELTDCATTLHPPLTGK